MQPSIRHSIEAEPLVLPRPAVNLALRVLQLLAASQHVAISIVVIDGVWYLAVGQSGALERLG